MIFEKDVNITANTSEISAGETTIKLPAGILKRIDVQFPNGCAGLAHARIMLGGLPIMPRNFTGSIKGDGSIVSSDEYIELKAGENEMRLITWNDDEVYNHKLTFRFVVLPRDVVNTNEQLLNMKNILSMIWRKIGIG